VVLPQAQKLPLVVQRTLSFLPVKLDPLVNDSAKGTIEWRLEMWRALVPQVPQYLFKGKGYALDPNDLYMAQQSALRGFAPSSSIYSVGGAYHNGPLSILIPFGIYGMIGFAWFVLAAVKVLWYYYRNGNPALQQANSFLLAAFIAKLIFFLFIFGGLHYDLFMLTGLVGLSVSLNGEPVSAQVSEPVQQESSEEVSFS